MPSKYKKSLNGTELIAYRKALDNIFKDWDTDFKQKEIDRGLSIMPWELFSNTSREQIQNDLNSDNSFVSSRVKALKNFYKLDPKVRSINIWEGSIK